MMDHREALKKFGSALRACGDVAAMTFVAMAETNFAFDPTTLGEHADMFATWVQGGEAGIDGRRGYRAGQIRNDPTDGILYRCSQTHFEEHAQAPPSQSPTLWGRIADPATEWPEWFPFNGSNADAWMKGDKCSHKGKKWVSDVDNNIWEPGVAMWTEWEE